MSITSTRSTLVVACLLICTAGCGESVHPTQSVQSEPSVLPVTVNSEQCEDPNTRLSGGVFYASDVESIPNEPYVDGWVATVTSRVLEELVKIRSLTSHATLEALQMPVLSEDFQIFSASAAVSATGQFSLTTPAGEQFVCYVASDPSISPGTKQGAMLGCAKVMLTGGKQRVQLFFGEGGFFVEQETS